MTPANDPFSVWAGERRIAIGAVMMAAVFVLTSNATARAQPSGRLDHSVVVANSRGTLSGSIETFAAGTRKNSKPEFRVLLKGTFPALQAASGAAVSPVSLKNFADCTGHCSGSGDSVVGFLPDANGVNIKPDTQIFASFGLETTPF